MNSPPHAAPRVRPPGKVTWAGYGLYFLNTDETEDPYGLAVAIKHDFGHEGMTLYTIYGHMDEVLVTKGQHVEGGDVIGLVGDTGRVTGVHLHFEVRLGKNNFFGSRNPELWLAPPQGWGVLAGRLTDGYGELLPRQKVQIRSYETGQYWEVSSYGIGSTNSDPYYRENLVIGGPYRWQYENLDCLPGSVRSGCGDPSRLALISFEGLAGFKKEASMAARRKFRLRKGDSDALSLDITERLCYLNQAVEHKTGIYQFFEESGTYAVFCEKLTLAAPRAKRSEYSHLITFEPKPLSAVSFEMARRSSSARSFLLPEDNRQAALERAWGILGKRTATCATMPPGKPSRWSVEADSNRVRFSRKIAPRVGGARPRDHHRDLTGTRNPSENHQSASNRLGRSTEAGRPRGFWLRGKDTLWTRSMQPVCGVI